VDIDSVCSLLCVSDTTAMFVVFALRYKHCEWARGLSAGDAGILIVEKRSREGRPDDQREESFEGGLPRGAQESAVEACNPRVRGTEQDLPVSTERGIQHKPASTL